MAEIARCKQSLVTCWKIRSLFVAEVAHCKKLFVSRYEKNPGTNVYLKLIKIEEFYLFILYCLKTNKDSVDNKISIAKICASSSQIPAIKSFNEKIHLL